MKLDPFAAILWLGSWAVIGTTTVWCFYKMLIDGRRKR